MGTYYPKSWQAKKQNKTKPHKQTNKKQTHYNRQYSKSLSVGGWNGYYLKLLF